MKIGIQKIIKRYDYKSFIIYSLIIVTMIITISLSHADYNAWKNGTEEASGITELVMEWIDGIFEVDSLASISNTVSVNFNFDQDIINIGGMTISGLSNAVKGVNDLMIIAATAIVVICFLIDLEKSYIRQFDWNAQSLVKKFIALGFALVCIGQSLFISEQIANFGSGMTSVVIEKLGSNPDIESTVDTIKELVYNDCQQELPSNFFKKIATSLSNVGTQLSYLVQLAPPHFVMLACSFIVNFICWGRAIQILILSALSPISFSDLVGERNGAGEKFVRNFLALALQGVVIVIVMFFCTRVIAGIMVDVNGSTSFSELLSSIYNIVVIGLVEMGLIVKSNNITREVVGLT